jgi:hypothetical protein
MNSGPQGSTRYKFLSWGAAFLFAISTLHAQQQKSPELSASDLVRETVAQEIAASNRTDIKHMFRSRKKGPKGSQTHLYIETNEAMAGMLVAVDDKPLPPEQEQVEVDHLNWLVNNPEALKKKHAREKEDADRSARILKALPDAFRYEFDGIEESTPTLGKEGDQLVRLKFSPNPSYVPPSRIEQVLAGMQGSILIDSSAHRLARIDGTLFRDVNFGWGIIGHLDKGGQFRVQQADVGEDCWELTAMRLRVTGKILMFKGISMVSDETFTDFQRVPSNLPFAKGVDLLKTEHEKLAHLKEPEARQSQAAPAQ